MLYIILHVGSPRHILISNLGSLGSFQGSELLRHGRKVEMTSSKKKYILNPRFV